MKMYHDGRNRFTPLKKTTKKQQLRMLGGKKTNKNWGILESDIIKQVEMKGKIQKEYLRRTEKLLETKLYSKNIVKEINMWSVLFVSNLELLLK